MKFSKSEQTYTSKDNVKIKFEPGPDFDYSAYVESLGGRTKVDGKFVDKEGMDINNLDKEDNIYKKLKGYIILAKKQYENPKKFSGAWNFGTESKSITNVEEVVRYMIKFWGAGRVRVNKKKNFYEQHNLQLNISKAKKFLKWYPTYNIRDSVRITTEWYYRVLIQKEDPVEVTNNQITDYMYENKWR